MIFNRGGREGEGGERREGRGGGGGDGGCYKPINTQLWSLVLEC